MKLDFYNKKEIKAANKSGHFFINLLKRYKKRRELGLSKLVSSKKYFRKLLKGKNFIPKIKMFYLLLLNLKIINSMLQTK